MVVTGCYYLTISGIWLHVKVGPTSRVTRLMNTFLSGRKPDVQQDARFDINHDIQSVSFGVSRHCRLVEGTPLTATIVGLRQEDQYK